MPVFSAPHGAQRERRQSLIGMTRAHLPPDCPEPLRGAVCPVFRAQIEVAFLAFLLILLPAKESQLVAQSEHGMFLLYFLRSTIELFLELALSVDCQIEALRNSGWPRCWI